MASDQSCRSQMRPFSLDAVIGGIYLMGGSGCFLIGDIVCASMGIFRVWTFSVFMSCLRIKISSRLQYVEVEFSAV